MKNFLLTLLILGSISLKSQTNEDAFYIRKIYDQVLTHSPAMEWLEYLTTQIGGRLAGSPQASASVEYTYQVMKDLGFDSVWMQPCEVPHWVRGEKEEIKIVNSASRGSIDLNGLSLGNSEGTGPQGITGEVIEVLSLDELEKLGKSQIEGKIVFFNRPMDPKQLNTFAAYGGAVDQRGIGASRASKLGAIGAIVRSMTTRNDDVPHTGSMRYEDGVKKIPAIAISTNDANLLSEMLKNEPVRVFMRNYSKMMSPKMSFNVIGEIKGSEFPNEIILVGGHLDSWDVGQGAHDDGTGCVQSIGVLQALKELGYQPKRTLRAVMFMNEENGLAGGLAYRDSSNNKGEYHLAAIESDRGGFTPRGFSCEGDPSIFKDKFSKVAQWLPLLEPYGLDLSAGGSGADIGPLKTQKGLLFGFVPDSQRYFDYHHTAIDNFDAVNRRELNLGTASMTSLVYLLDKYGL